MTTDHPGQAFRARLAALGWKGVHYRRAVGRLAGQGRAPIASLTSDWFAGRKNPSLYAWALLGALERMTARERAELARRG